MIALVFLKFCAKCLHKAFCQDAHLRLVQGLCPRLVGELIDRALHIKRHNRRCTPANQQRRDRRVNAQNSGGDQQQITQTAATALLPPAPFNINIPPFSD
ncbi:Uncharacterised protein [Shigella sonnei]|nr:Uncharacterised protein [Shigella sonnei]